MIWLTTSAVFNSTRVPAKYIPSYVAAVNGLRNAYTQKYAANAATAAYVFIANVGARSNQTVIRPRDDTIGFWRSARLCPYRLKPSARHDGGSITGRVHTVSRPQPGWRDF